MKPTHPVLLLALISACTTPPADVDRAREVIDSTRAAQRIDSLQQAAVADSLRDGYHAYRDGRGRILMEGEMRGGQRHGIWTSYGPNGRVQSRNEYANGVLNGMSTVFHDNGVLYYSGINQRGKPTGEWHFYDAQGALAKTARYDTTGTLINDRR